jgi:Domain of unknown function (DUF1924)
VNARSLALVCSAIVAPAIDAAAPAELLETWRGEARTQSKPFTDFSAERGKALYFLQPSDWSCSTCHTQDPRADGRHAVTHKVVKPLSPLANPARFSDAAKVEKWFRRNCRDVLKRECTATVKGDLLTYLMSTRQGGGP